MGNNIVKRVQWALLGQTSCSGCLYLYTKDEGYSNYTVEDTGIYCALDMNPHLLSGDVNVPFDWVFRHNDLYPPSDAKDNWPKTKDSRCEHFIQGFGARVGFDVDCEVNAYDFDIPENVATIINKHAGREPTR